MSDSTIANIAKRTSQRISEMKNALIPSAKESESTALARLDDEQYFEDMNAQLEQETQEEIEQAAAEQAVIEQPTVQLELMHVNAETALRLAIESKVRLEAIYKRNRAQLEATIEDRTNAMNDSIANLERQLERARLDRHAFVTHSQKKLDELQTEWKRQNDAQDTIARAQRQILTNCRSLS